MKIFPIASANGTTRVAFEIENVYIGLGSLVRVIKRTEYTSEVYRRRLFSHPVDVHIRFKYCGRSFMVWEPFGDNSRYWIGPDDDSDDHIDISGLERSFAGYQVPRWRQVLGDILMLRCTTRSTMLHHTEGGGIETRKRR